MRRQLNFDCQLLYISNYPIIKCMSIYKNGINANSNKILQYVAYAILVLFNIYMPKCLSHPKLLVDHQNGASLKHSLALKVAAQEKVKPQFRLVILYNLKLNN